MKTKEEIRQEIWNILSTKNFKGGINDEKFLEEILGIEFNKSCFKLAKELKYLTHNIFYYFYLMSDDLKEELLYEMYVDDIIKDNDEDITEEEIKDIIRQNLDFYSSDVKNKVKNYYVEFIKFYNKIIDIYYNKFYIQDKIEYYKDLILVKEEAF